MNIDQHLETTAQYQKILGRNIIIFSIILGGAVFWEMWSWYSWEEFLFFTFLIFLPLFLFGLAAILLSRRTHSLSSLQEEEDMDKIKEQVRKVAWAANWFWYPFTGLCVWGGALAGILTFFGLLFMNQL